MCLICMIAFDAAHIFFVFVHALCDCSLHDAPGEKFWCAEMTVTVCEFANIITILILVSNYYKNTGNDDLPAWF